MQDISKARTQQIAPGLAIPGTASSHRCNTHQRLVLQSSKLQWVVQWVMLCCGLLQTKVHIDAKDVQQQ